MTGTTTKTLTTLLFTLLVAITAHAQANGQNLLNNGDYAIRTAFWDSTTGGHGDVSVVDANIGPYRHALRVNAQPQDKDVSYTVEVKQRVFSAFKKGDTVSLKLWLRSPESSKLSVAFEHATQPFTPVMREEFSITPAWKEYVFTGTVPQDFMPFSMHVTFHLSYQVGTIEIAGVRLAFGNPDAQTSQQPPTSQPTTPATTTSDTTAPAPAAPAITDKIRMFLGPEAVAILQNATKVEAYRVDVTAPPEGKQKIGYYPVVGAVSEQDQTFARRLANVLLNQKTYMWAAASATPITGRCVLSPAVAYKIFRGEASVTVLVDYKCGEILFISDDPKETAPAFKSAWVAETHTDLTNLTIDAFPYHPPIQ